MKKNKPTTYGDIRGYVKRVNGEPEDLDLKARLKECRALMAQKNETQASEGSTPDTTPKKPKRAGKSATPRTTATKPEVAKPTDSKPAEQSERRGLLRSLP